MKRLVTIALVVLSFNATADTPKVSAFDAVCDHMLDLINDHIDKADQYLALGMTLAMENKTELAQQSVNQAHEHLDRAQSYIDTRETIRCN